MSQSHTNLDTNEITGIRLLYSYLYSEFVKDNFSAKLLEQLDFYISHLLIQRYSWIYDNDNLLFRIFGGVKADCKIGIYGDQENLVSRFLTMQKNGYGFCMG